MNKKLFTLIILCSFILHTYAIGSAATCSGTDILFLASATDATGDCITQANQKTHCGNNKFALALTNAASSACAHCETADKCAICTAMTKCTTVAYSSTAATGGNPLYLFPIGTTDATVSDRCLTCQDNTYFPKASAADDVGGTCTIWTTTGCQTGEAVIAQAVTTIGKCTGITADGTATLCATFSQDALFANNAAALAACATCTGSTFIKITTTGVTKGQCLALADFSCQTSEAVIQQTATIGMCTTITLSGTSNVCAGWTQTAMFANNAAALAACTSCGASQYIKITTTGATEGPCTAYADLGCTTAQQPILERTSFAICTTIAATVNGALFTSQVCASYSTQTTPYATVAAALADCMSCAAGKILLTGGLASGVGHCVLDDSSTSTKTYCAANSYPVYAVAPVAPASETRATYCQQASSYKCAYCKASTVCATFFFATALTTGTTETPNQFFYASEALGEQSCVTCQGGKYAKVTTAGNLGGVCTDFASFPCQAGEVVVTQSGSIAMCTATTVNAYRNPCDQVTYSAPLASANLALDLCNTCNDGQFLLVSAIANTEGSCIAVADINTKCTAGKAFINTNDDAAKKGVCTTVSAATVNSIAYTACKNFYYHNEDKKYYATVDAALSTGCIECTSASDVAIGADVNAVSGGCTAISNINTKCGTYNFLQSISSSATLGYCQTGQNAAGDTLACNTYYYSSSAPIQTTYTNAAAALQNCLTCAYRKTLVYSAITANTKGRCVDNPWSPVSPCTEGQVVKQYASGTDFVAYCLTPTAPSQTGQEACKTFFYGENLYFPHGTANYAANYNEYCFSCPTTSKVMLVNPGEKRGQCFTTADNAILSNIGGTNTTGYYLAFAKGENNFNEGNEVSILLPTPEVSFPFRQCLQYNYPKTLSLSSEESPTDANNNCVKCNSNQLLLILSGNSFGKCIISTDGACAAGQYVLQVTAIDGQAAGICTTATPSLDQQQVCKTYYYNSALFLTHVASVAADYCLTCNNDQYFFKPDQTKSYGQCFTKNALLVTVALGGDRTFLQYLTENNVATSVYIKSQAPCCKTFNYALNDASTLKAYRDIFEARNDCNVCSDGFIKISSSHCEQSQSCLTYSATNYESLELAEKSCLTCQPGYFLQVVTGVTDKVCKPLEGCLTFEGAAAGFASADAAKIKCKTCAAGYLLIKAAEVDTFGTCTVSTNCLESAAASPVTIAAFDLKCTSCKPGFYKVTLAVGDVTTNPCGPIPDAANCLQAQNIVLTAENVAANCVLCKAGYFPFKAAGGNAFGTCTLITKKQTCLEYTVGAALTEDAALLTMQCTKCPSEFYYVYGGKCYRCNDARDVSAAGCQTCLPTPMTIGTFTNAIFCTSCQEGTHDLVVFTGQMFGQCSACDSKCKTCSGTYINTSPDAVNRKCESCATAKYFALQAEFENGFCTNCFNQPHCDRCSGAGFCAQCSKGYFFNMMEMQCNACSDDCDYCKDRVTCIKKKCFAGCAECTGSTFAECSRCNSNAYNSGSACVDCASGCLECTASACTKYASEEKGATCIDGCKTCSGGFFDECSVCQIGYFKNTDGKVCQKCHSDCYSCTGPTMDDCLQCVTSGTFMLQRFPGASISYCALCDYNYCKTCGGKAPHQKEACTSCYGSQVIIIGYEGPMGISGHCVDKCPEGSFQDGILCRRCILGSPAPCPQPPAAAVVSASYLTLPILLIAFIIMML